MSNKFTAIIPVRAGSRRLKNKNIAPFGGTNLLLYKIMQLKNVKSIDRIVVSSDSDMMLDFAKEVGVETHKRAPEYCDEKTKSFGEVVAHIAESVKGENIVWATCTSPLVFPKMYEEGIELYKKEVLEENKYDSLISVESFKRYLWDENGPMNYELGVKHVPSQELPVYYFVTDGILIAPREKMVKWNYFHGVNPYKMELNKRACVDIDDFLDLAVARAWIDLDESVTHDNVYFTK
ncbi:acylneuraminate cytidylyltransferase family protein [Flavivirga amylovorans]|uniref:Acylneuraminate cytidylyltransferase family protein n=1 Tax=Flavivirga amylovorans TaxID=870486 RepID=A0ABT8X5V1_9FLAO|nr:acylneuraminate cytidylyltransferase family protein [Flavivirga amylovorans]MDO5989271.1 acylneuraminate cytidylyltransferase family protein [Flavivirga amylovorans]